MKQQLLMVLAMVLAVRATPVIAQDNVWQAVAPYVDEQTLVVAHSDLSKIDVQAMRPWASRLLEQLAANTSPIVPKDTLDDAQRKATDWLDRFRAAGGRDVHVVFGNISQGMMHYVFPVGPQADKEALVRLLNGERPADRGSGMIAEAMDGAVVMGSQAALDALRQQRATPRPDLEAAMAAGGDAPIRVAAGLSDDARRVIAELMPPLPPELGVQDSTVLARGFKWISIRGELPPQARLEAVVQATDPAAAQQLQKIVAAALELLKQNPRMQKQIPNLDQLTAALRPTVQQDTLRVSLDNQSIQQLAAGVIVPSLRRAREAAMRVQSAVHLRQIGQGATLYAQDHKGTYPDDMATLAKAVDIAPAVLKNPRREQWEVGYVYVKPATVEAKKMANEQVLAYERYERWGEGINVLFLDGHVEWVADEGVFNKWLTDSQKRNEAK